MLAPHIFSGEKWFEQNAHAQRESGKKQYTVVSRLNDTATTKKTEKGHRVHTAHPTKWNQVKIQTDHSLNLFRHFNLYISHNSNRFCRTHAHSLHITTTPLPSLHGKTNESRMVVYLMLLLWHVCFCQNVYMVCAVWCLLYCHYPFFHTRDLFVCVCLRLPFAFAFLRIAFVCLPFCHCCYSHFYRIYHSSLWAQVSWFVSERQHNRQQQCVSIHSHHSFFPLALHPGKAESDVVVVVLLFHALR